MPIAREFDISDSETLNAAEPSVEAEPVVAPTEFATRDVVSPLAVQPPSSPAAAIEREFEDEAEIEEAAGVTRTGATVSFLSGAMLAIVVGPGTATQNDDYWDPVASGNPLLDTSGPNKDLHLSKHFTVRELTTSRGASADVARVDPRLVVALQQLRDYVGKPVTITSGFRSWKRNQDVYAGRKQAPTLSQHCAGRAADIRIAGMNGLQIAKAAIDACGPNLGLGLGSTFAHVDVRPTPAVWDYGGATQAWIEEARAYQRAAIDRALVASYARRLTSSKAGLFAQCLLRITEGEPLELDGVVGTQTKAAIARFRSKYKLGGGDALDQRTLLALEERAHQSIFPQFGWLNDRNRNRLVEFALGPSASDVPWPLGLDTASVGGNTDPDWVKAKASVPIEFGIIRSNWGTARDGMFTRDWEKMKEAGIIRGAYLFLRFPHPKYKMHAPDPVAQAEAMVSVLGTLRPSDLPPTLDVEFPGGLMATGMSAQRVLDGVRSAWKVLKDHYGVAPIIYTSARTWHEDLQSLAAPDLAESPLWLARYPFKPGPAIYDSARVSKIRIPPVPHPWGDETNWWIHQYQGDAVRLPGFPSGNVDLNRFNVMSRDASGDRVRWVQRRLGLTETGLFDDVMEHALREFQRARSIQADGMVGIETFAYLCWARP